MRKQILEEVMTTVTEMIMSGGDVTVKHVDKGHGCYKIELTCKRTFYMEE